MPGRGHRRGPPPRGAAAHVPPETSTPPPGRLAPPLRLLTLAVDLGCEFAIDTDAHAPGQLDWQGNGCERAVECGVPAERVVNTRSADDLLAWTRG